MTIITCKNIHKKYTANSITTQQHVIALKDISFTVNKGEVFGIVGPNGAGKSTTLKILLGFVQPDSGSATIKGIPVQKAAAHKILGYLAENPTLYLNLSLRDHLNFVCDIEKFAKDSSLQLIDKILQRVDLKNTASLPLRQYSKGMLQRAGLACALVHQPELLILDEPMSGLDPLGRQLVLDIIKEWHARGTTVLFCSHILTDVERICDRIAIMDRGQLVDITTPTELLATHTRAQAQTGQTPLESYFLQKINRKSEQ